MNVLNLLVNRLNRPEISVVPSAPLPKPVCVPPVRLKILHLLKKFRRTCLNVSHGYHRDRLLDCFQDTTDLDPLLWPHEKVDMFRHKDVRPQIK